MQTLLSVDASDVKARSNKVRRGTGRDTFNSAKVRLTSVPHRKEGQECRRGCSAPATRREFSSVW